MDKFLQSSLKLQVSEEGRGDTHTHTHSALHIGVRMEERFLLEGFLLLAWGMTKEMCFEGLNTHTNAHLLLHYTQLAY